MANRIDSVLIKEPLKKKTLTLEFDEGDDIMSCIKEGLVQNEIREANVVDVDGVLTTATVNAMEGSRFKKIDFANTKILRASGHFKLGGGDLWGALHVFTEGRKPISGTLVRGTASQGFTLKLSFLPK
ncbi:MAG: PCC domain-containing protein [Candidatus Iainarchaeum sp.]